MKLTINRKTFLSALDFTIGCVEKRSTIPILAFALIQANGDVTVDTSDLSKMAHAVALDATIHEQGAGAIEAEKLRGFIRGSNGETVSISLANQWATVTCGGMRGRIPTLAMEEFPKFDAVDGERAQVPGDWFRDAVGLTCAVAAQAATEDQQKARLDWVKGEYRLQAMDGKRLYISTYKCDGYPCNFTLPLGFLKVLAKTDGDLSVVSDDNLLCVTSAAGMLGSRILAQPLRDFSALSVKWNYVASLSIPTAELKMAAAQAAMFQSGLGDIGVWFTVSGGRVSASKASVAGDYEQEIVSSNVTGEARTLLDYRLIADWCAGAKCSTTVLSIHGGETGPVKFEPESRGDGESAAYAYYTQSLDPKFHGPVK